MCTRGINLSEPVFDACAHVFASMPVRALFHFVFAHMCTDLKLRRYLQNNNDIGLIIDFDSLYFHSYPHPQLSKVNN